MPAKGQNSEVDLKNLQKALDLKKAARKTEARRARTTKEICNEIAPYAIKEEEDTTITGAITIMSMSTKLSEDGDYVDALEAIYDNVAITRVRELINDLDVTDALTKKEFDAACVQMLAILFVDQNTEVLMRTARTEIPKRAHGETIVGYHKRFMTASRANKFVMELNGHNTAKSEKAEEAMLYLKKINCSWAQSQFLRDATGGTNGPDQLMRMMQRHINLVDGLSIDDGKVGGSKQLVKELANNHIHEDRRSQVGNKRTHEDLMEEIANLREQVEQNAPAANLSYIKHLENQVFDLKDEVEWLRNN
jgi:polyhydroxyalkanoate synthesis regulator phasin